MIRITFPPPLWGRAGWGEVRQGDTLQPVVRHGQFFVLHFELKWWQMNKNRAPDRSGARQDFNSQGSARYLNIGDFASPRESR